MVLYPLTCPTGKTLSGAPLYTLIRPLENPNGTVGAGPYAFRGFCEPVEPGYRRIPEEHWLASPTGGRTKSLNQFMNTVFLLTAMASASEGSASDQVQRIKGLGSTKGTRPS